MGGSEGKAMPVDDAPSGLAKRVAALERRLAMVEARAQGGPRGLRRLLDTLLPPEARAHLRAARHEQLRAIRAVLDRRIERPKRDEDHRRRWRIDIE